MMLDQYKLKHTRKIILIGLIVLGSFILYKTFANFREEGKFPLMNGKVDYGDEDVQLAFYKDNELLDEMPEKNNADNLAFKYAKCDNGAYVEWDYDLWGPLVNKLTKNKTKCSLYFQSMYDDEHLYDLSPNNYDGTFVNGAIVKDDEDKKGIYFDGEDDYIDIVDLPSTIDWNSGFTIEFEAKWLSLNSWSRIFDFGNGQSKDNIFVANSGVSNSLNFDSRYGTTSRGNSTTNATITLNEIAYFKIENIKNEGSYTHNIYKNNELIFTKTYNVTDYLNNINRTENFLGKSNWAADKYFNGYIYYLKILDKNNNLILWYNVGF